MNGEGYLLPSWGKSSPKSLSEKKYETVSLAVVLSYAFITAFVVCWPKWPVACRDTTAPAGCM